MVEDVDPRPHQLAILRRRRSGRLQALEQVRKERVVDLQVEPRVENRLILDPQRVGHRVEEPVVAAVMLVEPGREGAGRRGDR